MTQTIKYGKLLITRKNRKFKKWKLPLTQTTYGIDYGGTIRYAICVK